ncbi:hypothetical protein EDC01DRAFT_629730 [Geopyxis carbonaria]|nr:hypothetical protein EDC01DRAFT_629730 [Geopyxis carbonaria]
MCGACFVLSWLVRAVWSWRMIHSKTLTLSFSTREYRLSFTITFTYRPPRDPCSPVDLAECKMADRDREAALGQTAILRAAFKLIDWVQWSTDNGIDTSRFYRLADQKVWTFVTEPEHELVNPAEIHQKLRQKYPDGFPESWKRSEEAIPTLEGFRRYATFWFHSVYDSTKGPRLAIHREELPEDFPDNEYDAFIQVAKVLTAHSTSDTPVPSSRRLSFSTPSGPHIPAPVTGDRSRSSRISSAAREPTLLPLPEPIVEMTATKFPGKLNADTLLAFDGTPGRVKSLDLTVRDLCGQHNYPVYYGGTVLGNVDEGFDYVRPGTAGSKPNYLFGSRLCSAITARFVDNARMWWEDYYDKGGDQPNCWKFSHLNPGIGSTKPDSIEEISLFEILKKYFPEENDETEARLELKRYRWNPAHKDAVPFQTFRTKATSLATRSGQDTWRKKCPLILDCIEPKSLRDEVRLYEDDEEKFWYETKVAVNTWLNRHPPVTYGASVRCSICNGPHDSSDCRRPVQSAPQVRYTKPLANKSRGDAACDWCGIKGHYKSECMKLKGQVSRGEVPAEERNKRGGPAAAPRPAAAASRSYLPRAGRPADQARRPLALQSCSTCGGKGHLASVCPSRKVTVTATNLVDDKYDDDSTGDQKVTSYLMDSWIPPVIEPADRRNLGNAVCDYEGIDDLFSTMLAGVSVDYPVYNNITTPVETVDVMQNVVGKTAKPGGLVKVSDAIDMTAFGPVDSECPTGPVWTISSTLRGHDLLTIFDTGAVKAAIPVSTANGSQSPWTTQLPHKLCFIKADGTRYTPAGYCPSFKFRFGTFEFDIEAYVVDSAPFQLLLGTEFLWATGAG